MTPEEKRQYYLTFHRFQQNREKYFAPAIYRAIRSQYNSFIKAIKAGKREDLALMAITAQPVNDVLKPLYIDAGVVYGAKVRAYLNRQKARMPIGFNERMIALMQAYLQTDILNTSLGITQTTIELIQKIMSDAAALGLGIDDIIKQLENTEISRMRARLIARTETVTAANQGAEFVAQDTGLLLNKEWLSTMDNRTRRDHLFVNGQIVHMDEYFALPGGITMKKPGDKKQKDGTTVPAREVCNCRCTTLYIPVRDGAGKLIRQGG